MTFELKHGTDNPRNSEGSFVQLKDGRILLIYTRYRGSDWNDHCTADLVSRISADQGKNWSEPEVVVANRAMNVMSVSLLRLQDGRIALLYLEKSAIGPAKKYVDCRPLLAFSSDEGKNWSEGRDILGIPPIYLVVNNDRLVQLRSGRLIIPAALHRHSNGGMHLFADTLFYLSDDNGITWRESAEFCRTPKHVTSGLREPGVVELSDDRVMVWGRTTGGFQYKAYSSDGGEHWSEPVPAYEFPSPESPLSLKRDPFSGMLFAVWNDYDPLRSVAPQPGSWGRTPLVIARSRDDGKTWENHTVLEGAPDHGFCYIAMLFDEENLYLEYCCGGGKESGVLQDARIRVLDRKSLVEAEPVKS